jgi:hypothetical protein
MFAGVLDGGQDEVFLGGTRLKRFMESVEKVTGAIPQPMPFEPEPPADATEAEPDEAPDRRPSPAEAAPTVEHQAWADVISAGTALLERLGQALGAGQGAPKPSGVAGSPSLPGLPDSLLDRDHQTGRPYLKLPLPGPEIVAKVMDLLGGLLKR